MRNRVLAVAVFLVGFTVLIASFFVKNSAETKSTAPSPRSGAVLPMGLFLTDEPAGAVPVEEAKKTAKVGDTVTVRGRVGGSKEPFVVGRAIFTLVGRGIPACTDVPGHGCRTPWDYCHETRPAIAEHSATIQVVDGAGSVLKESPKGWNGIKGLSELVVVGTVSQTDGDTLLINATGLYVAVP